jgi:cholesterol transport system auxiliary component
VTSGWRQALLGAAGILAVAALAGCALGPQAREQPASYDLGPPRNHAAGGPVIATTLLVPEITAPSWLDGQGIVYRLDYDNAARPQAYALSRWSAPPAALLAHRLRARFAPAVRGIVTGAHGTRADYALRVELEDFSHAFDAPDRSRVTVRARASLVDVTGRTLIAQRAFAIERPATSPDARGAVAALGEAADELIEQLLAWVGEGVKTARAR